MATIHHQVSINAPAAQVYRAIATADGISTWWDKQTPTQTDGGLVLEHNPGAEHGVVVELVANKRVEWECISTHPKTSPASAWTGTHFIFDIDEGDGGVRSGAERSRAGAVTVNFSQAGYDEQSEFFRSNDAAWGEVLQKLKQVVETQHS